MRLIIIARVSYIVSPPCLLHQTQLRKQSGYERFKAMNPNWKDSPFTFTEISIILQEHRQKELSIELCR
jgi:hypothetical protein